jgi:hypothetical protein
MQNTISISGVDRAIEVATWCAAHMEEAEWRLEFNGYSSSNGKYIVTINDAELLLAARIKFFQ